MDDNYNRTILFIKRRIKLNRFLLVIDTKKGVIISAITVIVSCVRVADFDAEKTPRVTLITQLININHSNVF